MTFRKLKSDLQERSGVKFHGLKTFRATFARVAKDRGATMEAVSRAMRHKTTKTTERYYARIAADNALAEIERAVDRPVKAHAGPIGSPRKASTPSGFEPDPVGVRTDPFPSELALDVPQRFNRTKLIMAGVVLPFE